ncbi:MAG: hypothetical protein L0312_24490 [Acidobacteria bacterium]|nr:hypothetical protein [Acidobacteriota bacterium]
MCVSSISSCYRFAKVFRVVWLLGTLGVGLPTFVEAASLASFTVNIPRIGRGNVVGGTSGNATAILSTAASKGGVTIQVLSNAAAASVQNIQIPAGQTTGSSPITTQTVTATASVTISARVVSTLGQFTPILTQTFSIVPLSLTSFSLSPLMIAVGGTASGNLQLNGAAPSGGFLVSISSSNTAVAAAPPPVSIPAGSNSGQFTISGNGAGCCFIIDNLGLTRLPLGVRTAPPAHFDLTVSNVTQTSAQGKIDLSFIATLANPVTVQLTSSNPALASVPASLTIAAGASKVFPITIGAGINECAMITARVGTGSDSVMLFTTLPIPETGRVITVGQ